MRAAVMALGAIALRRSRVPFVVSRRRGNRRRGRQRAWRCLGRRRRQQRGRRRAVAATTTDGGADARGNGGASGSAGTGVTDAAGDIYGAGCNTLAPGVAVTLACAPDGGTPPAPTGGTIVPGTYRLTAITEYGGCTAAALAETVAITANTIETALDSTINGLSYLNATYVVSGTDFVETGTCPVATTNNYQFSVNTTAGVTTITLISPGLVAVFTKQ